MNHFYEREEAYKQKILELEQTIKDKEYAHHDEMRKMEKNFFKQNQNLDSVNRAKIEDIQKNADKVAEQKVRDKEESIKRENKKLK
jgi:ADP-dependent phosphofructokinase/glucokinase